MTEMTSLQFDILTSLTSARRHGYGVVVQIREASGRPPGVATVYAALAKLERRGLVEPAGDEIVDGRVRRYYSITSAGSTELKTQARLMAVRSEAALRALSGRESLA